MSKKSGHIVRYTDAELRAMERRGEVKTDWNYSASYLGEFVERTIIAPEKEEMFKETYKNADEFCCLFVLDHDFTNFVYLPYPED